jgi:hypothetical protein
MTTKVTTEEVGDRVLEVLNSCQAEPEQALGALFDAMLCVLANIRCPDCRKNMVGSVQSLFPDMIAEALRAPSERSHVH